MMRKLLATTWSSLFIGSPQVNKYLQNISWLIFEKVFTFFIAMVVSIYVARYLRPG